MPAEVQMKAIAYMAWMRAPASKDAPADAAFAEALAKKLEGAVSSFPKLASQPNSVHIIGGGRQIDLLTGGGCVDKMPAQTVVGKTATQLSALAEHGVLVIRCNDARIQCLQSTRDPADVLCTTAPRK
jgi:hypothetical protein